MNRRFMTALSAIAFAVAALATPAAGQLGARPADDWIKMLDSPARVAGLKVDEVIARLGLKPGEVVADLGAGTGVFAVPLARAVGPSGKVYAVEVEQGLVDHIAAKAAKEGTRNVHAVLGRFADPALPSSDVDVAFIHDVLHHVEDRRAFLRNAARYMKPTGRFAIVELDAETGPHRNDPKLQITRDELRGWMAEIGYAEAEEVTNLFDDGKWFVIYARTR